MPNAVQMIRQDHKKVKGLFRKFDQAKNNGAKKRIADQVIQELEVHTTLEEEIFYPAVQNELGDKEMIDEANKEHQQAKEIIQELKTLDSEDDQLEEQFAELVECIKHHVEEEESEMLPKAEESSMDLTDYGKQMSERKAELTGKTQTKSSKSKAGRKAKAKSKRRRSRRAA
ncbi:MAG TPA: hemerythrin domain-containing protein [Verrucomicrobiae bacterium]|nr:hemerythrin domain-containing protein [Verrucomicrobiae bacterium]